MSGFDGLYLRYTAWIRGVAGRPVGFVALFVIAFAEGSLIPISVDVPLIALALARRKAAIAFGVVAVAGSLLGGFAGYAIGSFLFERFGNSLLITFGLGEHVPLVVRAFADHGVWVFITAGFTPLPFVLYTVAAGWSQSMDPAYLAIGMVIGRAIRFMPVALLVHFLGERTVALMDRYRFLFVIIGTVLLLAGIGSIVWHFL